MSRITFLFVDQSSRIFFVQLGRDSGLKILVRCAIYRSFPEILAIKVESCQKSRRNLDVFSPSQILGGRPSKTYAQFITPASRRVAWEKFCEDTATSAEVIWAQTLNFRSNFKFPRLNFLGDPRHSGSVRYRVLVNL